MNLRTLLLLALVSLPVAAQAAPPRCLAYGPAISSIGGRLEKVAGKAPGEEALVLVLTQPACMTAGREQADAKAIKQVQRVLILADARRHAQLSKRVGQRMGLRGRLSPAPAGAHRAPLQLALVMPE
ncbi:hypothetical protein [Roseateles microcysteis]|uniref:hypothetical protein n=1 Tax=Roseateles microcysteis TaxID=3119057 RepID=UPI002FE5FCEC